MSSVEKAISTPGIALASDLAALCKASADSLRLQVLRVLREDSFGVSELCSIFDIRQPALSHHLKVLANAGLVATRREGNSIFYRRSELGQRPELEAPEIIDIGHVGEVDQIDTGVLSINKVVPDSPAYKANMRAGDVLLAVNGVAFANSNMRSGVRWALTMATSLSTPSSFNTSRAPSSWSGASS